MTAPLLLVATPTSAGGPGTWGDGWVIETNNTWSAYYPQVALDPSGNAVAVWQQSDGTRHNIWANRYIVGSGWGTARLIETDNEGSAWYPQAAVDASGNAVVVWRQLDGSRYNIWANRYDVGSGWGTAQLIETEDAGSAYDPQVALDGSGNAVAVWRQWDGTSNNIWANRYVVGSGWGTAQLIETDNAGYAYYPQVAVDASGNAVAVWVQYDGTQESIWANHFVEDYPPALLLASPTERSSTNRSGVWVAGTTEPGARVSVNGIAASVAPDGSFGLLLALAPGANLVEATAWDVAGNSANVSVNVTYDDPVPAIEQQLAEAQAGLTAAQADLAASASEIAALQASGAATQAELDTALADLTSAQAQIDALSQDANATESELAEARADLTAAEARVTALEVDQSATQADLDAARAELAAAQAEVDALEAADAKIRADLEAARADSTELSSALNETQATVQQQESDLDLLRERADSAEAAQAAQQASVDAAAASAGTATAIAALAVVLAVAGIAAGFLLSRRGGGDPTRGEKPDTQDEPPPP